jgi:hypothetical protein
MYHSSPFDGVESLSFSANSDAGLNNGMQLFESMIEDYGIQMSGIDVSSGGNLAVSESYLNPSFQYNMGLTSHNRDTAWKSTLQNGEISTKAISLGRGSNVMTTPDTYLAPDNASPGTGVGIRAD